MTILLACDRTGGHVYPAEILADYVKQNKIPEPKVIFYGLRSSEAQRIRDKGYVVCGLEIKRRNILLEALVRFFELVYLVIRYRPARVVGFGGRTGFLLLFVCSFFIPTAIYEPNAVYGKANNLLKHFVKYVFLGLKKKELSKELVAGIPLRRQMLATKVNRLELLSRLGLEAQNKTILVFGGSSGAHSINMFLKELIVENYLSADVQLIHLTGPVDYQEFSSFYAEHKVNVKVMSYYEKIYELYSVADVVVSRAGASTIAELCFLKKKALLIPYPYAYDHQWYNASLLADVYGVSVMREKELTVETLSRCLSDLLSIGDNELVQNRSNVWKDPVEFSRIIAEYML